MKVLHIDDLLVAECDLASDAPKALAELVDAYLEDCAELGREPTRPFKGTFNVRGGPERHKRTAMSAAEEGVSLNNWVQSALEEKLTS